MATRSGSAGHPRHTVLVVDDNADGRESLALLLECRGFGVATAGNGLEALHLMVTLGMRPCVVVVDLIMPVMDGLALHERMAAEPDLAEIPLIGLTGHEGLRRDALSEGFAAALLKPGNVDDLISLLVNHCASIATRTTAMRRRRA